MDSCLPSSVSVFGWFVSGGVFVGHFLLFCMSFSIQGELVESPHHGPQASSSCVPPQGSAEAQVGQAPQEVEEEVLEEGRPEEV